MVAEDDALSNEKEIDKLVALISLSFKKIYKPTNNNLRTLSNTNRVNQDNTPRTNRVTRHDNQRAVNVVGSRETIAYHKEKMLLCKQKEAGIQLSIKQVDWRDDTNNEPEYQELEAHYSRAAEANRGVKERVEAKLYGVRTKVTWTGGQGLLGMRLCLSCLTSQSMISIGSSTKLSLSSSRNSFIGITRDSSDKHFFKLEIWEDLEWSNVSWIKLPSLSESDDTFTSLQALSNLHYLFSGFMDYFWSCELNISNFGPADSWKVDS
nr:hypothetical protein [Tanacetum cinerariifolium]